MLVLICLLRAIGWEERETLQFDTEPFATKIGKHQSLDSMKGEQQIEGAGGVYIAE